MVQGVGYVAVMQGLLEERCVGGGWAECEACGSDVATRSLGAMMAGIRGDEPS